MQYQETTVTNPSNRDFCTVCIYASPITDHPNITHIKETIDSLDFLSGLDGVRVLLSHDGNEGNLISDDTYHEYFEHLQNFIQTIPREFQIIRLQEREYLTGNFKNAMRYVDTPWVLNVLHDIPFVREINLSKVFEDIREHPQFNHIRFNRRSNVFKGHDARGPNAIWEEFQAANYTYVKTNGWSTSTHLARKDYLMPILERCDKNSPEKFIMRLKDFPPLWREWTGTYLLGGFGDLAYTKHSSARKGGIDFWNPR